MYNPHPTPPHPLEAVENAGVDHGTNEVSVTNHKPAAKPHFMYSQHKRSPSRLAINNMSAAIKMGVGVGGEGRNGGMKTAGGAFDEFFPLDMFAVFLEEDLVAELKCQQTLSGSGHADRVGGVGGGSGRGRGLGNDEDKWTNWRTNRAPAAAAATALKRAWKINIILVEVTLKIALYH